MSKSFSTRLQYYSSLKVRDDDKRCVYCHHHDGRETNQPVDHRMTITYVRPGTVDAETRLDDPTLVIVIRTL